MPRNINAIFEKTAIAHRSRRPLLQCILFFWFLSLCQITVAKMETRCDHMQFGELPLIDDGLTQIQMLNEERVTSDGKCTKNHHWIIVSTKAFCDGYTHTLNDVPIFGGTYGRERARADLIARSLLVVQLKVLRRISREWRWYGHIYYICGQKEH